MRCPAEVGPATAKSPQSVSDWLTPQNDSGESQAVTMAYRDLSNGTKDNRNFYGGNSPRGRRSDQVPDFVVRAFSNSSASRSSAWNSTRWNRSA